MTFRFIHAADIHLDSPLRGLSRYEGAPVEQIRQASRRALENLVELAIAEDVDFVIIAGDLFDGEWRDYNTGLYFVTQMARLNENEIPVYLLKGNHDAANKATRTLPLPANVHVFSHKKPETFHIEQLGVALHGQSFPVADVREDLSNAYPPSLPGKFNIGVLHTCASGRDGHDSYAPCKIESLAARGYNYWALGHIHKREELSSNPLIVFPGNIQGRHIRETGPKGCSLVSVDERFEISHEFRELAVLRWELLNVDLSESKSEGDALAAISAAIAKLSAEIAGTPLALRVVLQGRTPLDSMIRSKQRQFVESVRAIAIQNASGNIWIEKIKIQTAPALSKAGEQVDGPIYELLSMIQEFKEDPESLELLQSELGEIRSRLPAELPELKQLSSNEWLKSSLADAQEILMDRLLKPRVEK